MAFFPRTNGDLKPVAVQDTHEYVVGLPDDIVTGETVNTAGPKLDFFTLTITSPADAVRAIQQLALIYKYEFATATELHVGLYPTGAWDTTTIVSESSGAITAATTGATFSGN